MPNDWVCFLPITGLPSQATIHGSLKPRRERKRKPICSVQFLENPVNLIRCLFCIEGNNRTSIDLCCYDCCLRSTIRQQPRNSTKFTVNLRLTWNFLSAQSWRFWAKLDAYKEICKRLIWQIFDCKVKATLMFCIYKSETRASHPQTLWRHHEYSGVLWKAPLSAGVVELLTCPKLPGTWCDFQNKREKKAWIAIKFSVATTI